MFHRTERYCLLASHGEQDKYLTKNHIDSGVLTHLMSAKIDIESFIDDLVDDDKFLQECKDDLIKINGAIASYRNLVF